MYLTVKERIKISAMRRRIHKQLRRYYAARAKHRKTLVNTGRKNA